MGAALALPLNTQEQARLGELEQVVERGLGTFREVGEALATIRDMRLYRAAAGTFEEYAKQRFGLSRPYAYQLMDAAKVTRLLMSGTPDIQPPANETQAAELVPVMRTLGEEAVKQVWQRTVELSAQNGGVTAEKVKETASAFMPARDVAASMARKRAGKASRVVRVDHFAKGLAGDHETQLVALAIGDIKQARTRLEQTRAVPGIVTRLEGIEDDLKARLAKAQADIREQRESEQAELKKAAAEKVKVKRTRTDTQRKRR